jgi:succinyl-diaminopimelate desuccinylase
MDEARLAERLIRFDTSSAAGLDLATEFVASWLADRAVVVHASDHPGGRRSLLAHAGSGPTRLLFCGHLDVVPGAQEQFMPSRSDGILLGRGAYDMKAALATMMIVTAEVAARPRAGLELSMLIVPDEERADLAHHGNGAVIDENCTEIVVRKGLTADFVICGEPTDMRVGTEAKGVLMVHLMVGGRAAHGSTPWLGENAVLRATELFRRIEALPFAGESSESLERPSINLARIRAGGALNVVPARCEMDIDIRYLPGQSADRILEEIRSLGSDVEPRVLLRRAPVQVPPDHPLVEALLRSALEVDPEAALVGRHGASDVGAFLSAGIPAVEFGPRGGGHHGPREYVEVESLAAYRRALSGFVEVAASTGRAGGVTR